MRTLAPLPRLSSCLIACVLVALLSLLAGPALAQTDTIVRTNGDEVPGRVLSISPLSISYVTGTDTVRVPTTGVFLIRYANGTKEVISRLTTPTEPAKQPDGPSGTQLEARGRADALVRYRGSQAVTGAAAATFFLGPVLGLLSTSAIANAPVQLRNLDAPAPAMLTNSNYAAGYSQQADATKRRQAWKGYGIGVGLQLVLIGLVIGTAGN
ncbi:hypothetical protein [Hymenobacter arizonensis]|uniref:Uncharacterized protein n=1 Tax=Hymenobacter arizonensis TaxID=1227077 RepID=A0A1I5WLY9_HYMAR|nr:hypothetical protein [Hymenobacter arizonensis]SFQ20690.1 hypothetical protein SAMN04515668_1386 [Hymenobacter arizonensis]